MGLFRKLKHSIRRMNRIKDLEKSYAPKSISPINIYNDEPFNFESSLSPLVSILIPFYNEKNYTVNCLKHLHSHLDKTVAYEIILIDDNSTDDVNLEFISGIKIIRNNQNLGFLKNINIGIKEAVGQFVYILNNDTEVQDGFLNELLNVFYTFPNVGAVGSKLINADGTLQEAGSVFLKDCSIHNIAGKRKVFYPQINYTYKVDYSSGCSLLFKKYNDAGEINLFDKQFAPAYFEETDFCFQLKYLQHKDVYYCPFSEVLHYNGVSYNSEKNNYIERTEKKEALFKINLEKFKSKWQAQIDAIKASTIEERIEELYGNKSIVIFCGRIPEHDKDSGSNRLKEIIEAYKELGFNVLLIKSKNYLKDSPYIEYYQRLGVHVFYEHKIGVGIGEYIKNNISNATISWYYNPDIFIEHFNNLKNYLQKSTVVFDMVDIHHLRFKRALELQPQNKKLQKQYSKYLAAEKEASLLSDFVVTISDQEAKYMETFCEAKKIITISNIHYTRIAVENTLPFEDRKDILFIGSIHEPNIDALYFLYKDIMPLVWEKLPHVKVNIIGNIKDKIQDINHPNILFKGYVPNIEELFLSNKYMIAPLRYGAGVKGKIGQAFEYFLPVITTTIGAEGMQLIDGESALIYDDATGFANAIINLYNNKTLWLKLQSNSEKNLSPFSKKKLKEQLLKIKPVAS
jgi:O-antigen biosynthesis protein